MELSKVREKVYALAAEANFSLRKDLKSLLLKAQKKEKKNISRKALGWILENAALAKKEKVAICQDTGLPVVFVEIGKGIKASASLMDTIKKAVEDSYRDNYLRPSLVEPLLRASSSYRGAIIHCEFSRRQGLKVTLLPKGFGSENKTCLKMFNPTASLQDIENFIIGCVRKAGPEACPPFIVGVGIGGTSDYALILAKKALLERVDRFSKDERIAKIERNLLRKINGLKIGPMGLGGSFSALAVKVKTAPTHIAGFPVGVNISCWALRSASCVIK